MVESTVALLVTWGLALTPALVGWLWGRAILRRRHEPALPERLKRRLVWVLALAWLVVFALILLDAGWPPGVLAVLGAIVSGFPLRRALLEERWGLGRYVWFQGRFLVALIGFWVLLGTAPTLALSTGAPVAAGLVLGAVLVAWNLAYSRVLRALTAARPMTTEESRRVGDALDRIDAAAGVAPPRRLVIPVPGGRFANGLAIAGKEPMVLLTKTVLDEFEPPELAAVYAHEIAHIERLPVRRLRRRELVVRLLVAAAVVLPLAPLSSWVLWLGWPAAVLFTMLVAFRPQQEELESDLRAAELCGDPEAVELALVKLHAVALLPRRMSPEETRYQTHPSLARRIQALRRLADGATSDEEASGEGRESATAAADRDDAVVIRGRRPGTAILLGDERITWLEGVPDGGPHDPEELRSAADSARSMAYRRLSDLRLDPGGFGRSPALVAREAGRRPRRTAVLPADAAALEAALDRVDPRLGEGAPASRTMARALAAVALLAALVSPLVASAVLLALIALIRPRPAPLAAAGAGGLAAALWSARATGPWSLLALPPEADWLPTLGLALAAGLLLALGVRRARHETGRRTGSPWPLAVSLGLLSVPVWVPAILSGTVGGIDPFGLHDGVRSLPATIVFPAGTAAALLVAGGLRERIAALAPAAVALLALALGSSAFRLHFLDDPLMTVGRPERPRRLEPRSVREVPVDRAYALRLSPSGRTAAIEVSAPGERASWTLRSVDSAESPTPSARVKALDVALPRDDQALALRPAATDGGRPGLSSFPVGSSGGAGWTLELPALDRPELAASGDGWRVWGVDPEEPTGATFRLLEGRLDGRIESRLELIFERREHGPPSYPVWTPLGDGAALAVTHDWVDRGPDSIPSAFGGFGRPRRTLWRVRSDGVELLAASRLPLGCLPVAERAVCAAGDGEWTHLWSVRAVGPLRPLPAIPDFPLTLTEARGMRVLLHGTVKGQPLVVPASEGALRTDAVALEELEGLVETRLAGSRRLVALFGRSAADGSGRLVVYELPEAVSTPP